MEVDDEVQQDKKGKPLSKAELEELELADARPISRHEYSPAAFIFQPTQEEANQILFEEKSRKVKCPHCDAVSWSIVSY